MFYISYGCTFLEGPTAWRVPWGLQMLPAVLLFFGLFLLPESPRWLARHDKWEEAHAVLTLVHGKGDPNAPFVTLEMEDIKHMIVFERQNADVSFMELFRPRMLNRLHIGVFTQIWSQLTGMNVMMYYVSHLPLFHCIESYKKLTTSRLHTSSGWLALRATTISSPLLSNMSSTSS